jgi:hypothetical protein
MTRKLLKRSVPLLLCCSIAAAQTCPVFTPVTDVKLISPMDKIFRFSGGIVAIVHAMAVDTDGSPFSYHPQDKGTSFLCDGLDPYSATTASCDSTNKSASSACFKQVRAAAAADWDRTASGPFCIYGFESPGSKAKGTTNLVWGGPFGTGSIPVQTASDPAPGFFISTTGFANPDASQPAHSQRHFISADTIPYVVVPGKLIGPGKDFPSKPTPAWAWSLATNNESSAVTGDVQSKFGEGSVALAQVLQTGAITPITSEQLLTGSSIKPPFPYVSRGGAVRVSNAPTGTIIFVYFSHSPAVPDVSVPTLNNSVESAFKMFGGKDKFKTCLKQL